jgi:hypothetical protein
MLILNDHLNHIVSLVASEQSDRTKSAGEARKTTRWLRKVYSSGFSRGCNWSQYENMELILSKCDPFGVPVFRV